jgi:hypothetical protein
MTKRWWWKSALFLGATGALVLGYGGCLVNAVQRALVAYVIQ